MKPRKHSSQAAKILDHVHANCAGGPTDGGLRRSAMEEGAAHQLPGARKPLVSVIIPCYNHSIFLSEAIESVLNQSYNHREILIIDDGSTDRTPEVAKSYPEVRYYRQHNLGPSAARNTGTRLAVGDYIVFLDSDDRLRPSALEAGIDCH